MLPHVLPWENLRTPFIMRNATVDRQLILPPRFHPVVCNTFYPSPKASYQQKGQPIAELPIGPLAPPQIHLKNFNQS